ncbi:MAG: histidine phosphatase family protein [Albidovulum sp.]|nr:histidine phosphatase family protein [Albidovulum sp.]
MKLILMRHAKSSWANHGLADFSRPLNRRGRASADAVGRWLSHRGHAPDALICSPSARTTETWRLVSSHFTTGCSEEFDRSLYHGGASDILRTLSGAGGARCVMIIGHNPSMQVFAATALRRVPDHPEFTRYPTAATLVSEFQIDSWRDVETRTGEFIDFIVPRELIQS